MNGPPSAHTARVLALSRMSKASLAGLIRQACPNLWTAAPLERWSKDELVRLALDLEFPEVTP